MSIELAHIAVRAAFGYVVLLALLRTSGKRTIAQGTAFDFVLALVMGDMVDDLLWGDVPAATFVAAVGTLTLAHTLVSWGACLSPPFARVVEGKPTVILSQGEPVEKGLRSEHVTEEELEGLLRLCGVAREQWTEVETALLEESGHPSLTRKLAERPAERRDVVGVPDQP